VCWSHTESIDGSKDLKKNLAGHMTIGESDWREREKEREKRRERKRESLLLVLFFL